MTVHDATPTPPAALAQRFDLLAADATEYALFLTDPDGRVLSWNPGAERLFGYRADEAVGRHFSRFFSPRTSSPGSPSTNSGRRGPTAAPTASAGKSARTAPGSGPGPQ